MYDIHASCLLTLQTFLSYRCLFIDPLVMYGLNISYFTIVFLFNLGILITVSRQIIKLRHVGNKQGKMPVLKDAGTVLGLMCLLGTTWGLIFFSLGFTNYPILYLFCILNTMQGRFSQSTRENNMCVNDVCLQ